MVGFRVRTAGRRAPLPLSNPRSHTTTTCFWDLTIPSSSWASGFSRASQGLQCGATLTTPTGFSISTAKEYPNWDNFGTSSNDVNGDACFFGNTGNSKPYG